MQGHLGQDPASAELFENLPETRTSAQQNRGFLQRVVRYLAADAGITQFLDLGSGVPTVGNVHEIAQGVAPAARVVYVDHEPAAVAQSQQMLADNDRAIIIRADLRYPDLVLQHAETRRLLDFSQPVAVLMIEVFPFIADEDDPIGIIEHYRNACAPGSYLALSHGLTPEFWASKPQESSAHPPHLRDPDQVAELFSGYRMVEPGLVFTSDWRPDRPITDEQAKQNRALAGLGALPE
ncbi:SAM-dependent methyltransferase [Saccharopolyspora sp. K220]|uniref:SAM-dependent methyltransferase n=1 Tax=Saccharopolyspora soli TaxID=2926618 RepID=UPI001F5977DC|nr:SAM-dependent methyltransferase [Saccharopolyspora soli]MCI2417311.1 SAM-dependent methyltransferase [Saccharopolyspora soli]